MEQYNIIGVPDSIKVEWEFTFPDEKRHNSYLGSVSGCYDGCLEGSPEDVYSEYYVDTAASFVMSLYCLVTDAYMLGIIPCGMTCRDYFHSCVPKHIKLVQRDS